MNAMADPKTNALIPWQLEIAAAANTLGRQIIHVADRSLRITAT